MGQVTLSVDHLQALLGAVTNRAAPVAPPVYAPPPKPVQDERQGERAYTVTELKGLVGVLKSLREV